nr:uncharacterized protein LOC123281711 [Equus asinus]
MVRAPQGSGPISPRTPWCGLGLWGASGPAPVALSVVLTRCLTHSGPGRRWAGTRQAGCGRGPPEMGLSDSWALGPSRTPGLSAFCTGLTVTHLGRAGEGAVLEKPGNPSSHWLWVQCPALQGPTQQLRGRGTDKGSREALPPKGGGWGPWTHPPHCWEVRRGEGPVHPDVSINSCSVPPRQGPQLPRASSFLILGGRAIFVSPHSFEAVHPAQRPIQGSHHEMTSCYLSGEPRIALTSLLPPSQAPPQGRQQLVKLSQRHHSRTRRQESTSLPTPVSRAVMGRRSLLSPHQGAHKHNGNRKRKWPRNCQSTGRMLSSWAGKSPYTLHPTWGLAWRP